MHRMWASISTIKYQVVGKVTVVAFEVDWRIEAGLPTRLWHKAVDEIRTGRHQLTQDRKVWVLEMTAQPLIDPWSTTSQMSTNGAELQRAIIMGYGDEMGDPIWSSYHKEFVFEKEFSFKEHGEFFRGALTMAGIRYARDFYELLKRYEKIKVTITKAQKEDR
jgi:hypothetical protein